MERFQDGSIKVSMETFTRKLLEKFWQGKINSSFSPLGLDKLCDDDPPDTDNYPVRPAIGNFIWLAINLRFDIAPAVNVIARKQTKPSAKLVKFIKACFFPLLVSDHRLCTGLQECSPCACQASVFFRQLFQR